MSGRLCCKILKLNFRYFMTIFCFRIYGCLPSCLICSRSLNTKSLFNFGDCVFRLFFRNSCHFSQTKFPSHFLCACFHCIISNAKLHFISVLTLAISKGLAIDSWTFFPIDNFVYTNQFLDPDHIHLLDLSVAAEIFERVSFFQNIRSNRNLICTLYFYQLVMLKFLFFLTFLRFFLVLCFCLFYISLVASCSVV